MQLVTSACSLSTGLARLFVSAFHTVGLIQVLNGQCCAAGMICTKCSPHQVVSDAIYDARSICMREYATAPEVKIFGDPKFTFPYVPSHLHHMAFELVKNSLRAVNDKYEDLDDEPPPIRLVIADGEEDVTIKASTCIHAVLQDCHCHGQCDALHEEHIQLSFYGTWSYPRSTYVHKAGCDLVVRAPCMATCCAPTFRFCSLLCAWPIHVVQRCTDAVYACNAGMNQWQGAHML